MFVPYSTVNLAGVLRPYSHRISAVFIVYIARIWSSSLSNTVVNHRSGLRAIYNTIQPYTVPCFSSWVLVRLWGKTSDAPRTIRADLTWKGSILSAKRSILPLHRLESALHPLDSSSMLLLRRVELFLQLKDEDKVQLNAPFYSKCLPGWYGEGPRPIELRRFGAKHESKRLGNYCRWRDWKSVLNYTGKKIRWIINSELFETFSTTLKRFMTLI